MTAATYAEMIYELGGFLLIAGSVILCCIVSGIVSDVYGRIKRRKKS